MDQDILKNVKLFLGLTESETEKDDLLLMIIGNIKKQILAMPDLTLTEIPPELDFMIEEIAIVRYNRIGSEGLKSETVEGYRADYTNDDFKPYAVYLAQYLPQDTDWQEGSVEIL